MPKSSALNTLVGGLSGVSGIVVDNGRIYILDSGGISPLNGGVARVDATHVYFVDRGAPDANNPSLFPDGAVRRVPKTGGAVQTVGSSIGNPVGLFLTATHVYLARESTNQSAPNGAVIRFAK